MRRSETIGTKNFLFQAHDQLLQLTMEKEMHHITVAKEVGYGSVGWEGCGIFNFVIAWCMEVLLFSCTKHFVLHFYDSSFDHA